ncbi:MAG: DUF192 domain-containing protein [Myxococcales bacterium]
MEIVSAENATRGGLLAEHTERTTSARERLRGLLGRDGLPHGHALLIEPCNSIHTFFMRFPIDVLFLDRGGKVVRALPRLRPWRATRVHLKAHSVLELWPGALEERPVSEGDLVRFSNRV